jgi:arylsulfatase A-like enzyme
MRRLPGRVLALLACGLLALSCRLPVQRGRWNVVVVLVDTLRADHLGAYGYRRATSPGVDALAAGAYLFTDARAQASCTYPSVNSILTGRYPARFLGQPDGAMGIPAGVPSLAELLAARGWSTGAVSASAVVRDRPTRFNPHGGFARGFGRFDEECLWRDATCVTRHGIRAVERLREPVFAYLHYIDPHGPYDPPRPQRKQFRWGRATQAWALAGNPNPLAQQLDGLRTDVTYGPPDVRFLQGLYDGEVAFVDGQIAAFVDALRDRKLLERTILVVLADHGESFLEHGTVKHCRNVFDSEVKTPLLVRLPRQREGVRIAGPVGNVDLAPTLVDLLGLPVEGQGFDGASLVPRLDGAGPADRVVFSSMNAQRAVAGGRYKLVADLGRNEWRLFDLARDPGERRDVKAEAREPFARLRGQLLAWIARVEGKDGLRQAQEAERQLRALGYL